MRPSYILKCQKDSYARCLKHVSESKIEENVTKIKLEDTIFFPEGGGQPCDLGVLKDGSINYNVVDVQRDDDGVVWHLIDKAVDAVPTKLELLIDWERRFNHMQQHSGQHLLSAVALLCYDLSTVSWSLTKDGNLCYVDLEGEKCTDEILSDIESAVNENISAGLKYIKQVHSPEHLGSIDATSRAIMDNRFPVRVIQIEGLDNNMCCATQELQMCKLFKSEVIKKSKTKGNVVNRVYFLFGNRLRTFIKHAYLRTRALNSALSAQPNEHLARVQDLLKAQKKQTKILNQILGDLARTSAQTLMTELSENPDLIFHHYRFGNAAYTTAFLQATKRQPDTTVFVIVGDDLTKGEGMFVLAGPADKLSQIKPKLLVLLSAKGGGKATRIQGKFGEGILSEAIITNLKEIFSSY